FSAPPMHCAPSPNVNGDGRTVPPWRKRLSAEGSSPDVVSTIVSGSTVPSAESLAPPVAAELSQPRPLDPPLPQGQGTLRALPSGGQRGGARAGQPSWRAREISRGASIATHRGPGGVWGASHPPPPQSPQASTAPSLRRATVCRCPAATSTYRRP